MAVASFQGHEFHELVVFSIDESICFQCKIVELFDANADVNLLKEFLSKLEGISDNDKSSIRELLFACLIFRKFEFNHGIVLDCLLFCDPQTAFSSTDMISVCENVIDYLQFHRDQLTSQQIVCMAAFIVHVSITSSQAILNNTSVLILVLTDEIFNVIMRTSLHAWFIKSLMTLYTSDCASIRSSPHIWSSLLKRVLECVASAWSANDNFEEHCAKSVDSDEWFLYTQQLLDMYVHSSPESVCSGQHDVIPQLDQCVNLLANIAASCVSVCGGVVMQNKPIPTSALIAAACATETLQKVINIFVVTLQSKFSTGKTHFPLHDSTSSRLSGGRVAIIRAIEECKSLWVGVIDVLMRLLPCLTPKTSTSGGYSAAFASTKPTTSTKDTRAIFASQSEAHSYSYKSSTDDTSVPSVHYAPVAMQEASVHLISEAMVDISMCWFQVLADILPLHFFHHCRFGLPLVKSLLAVCGGLRFAGGLCIQELKHAGAVNCHYFDDKPQSDKQPKQQDKTRLCERLWSSQSIIIKMLQFSSKFDVDIINGVDVGIRALTQCHSPSQYVSSDSSSLYYMCIRVHIGILSALMHKMSAAASSLYETRGDFNDRESNLHVRKKLKSSHDQCGGYSHSVDKNIYQDQEDPSFARRSQAGGFGSSSDCLKSDKLWAAFKPVLSFVSSAWTGLYSEGNRIDATRETSEVTDLVSNGLHNAGLEALLVDVLDLLGIFVDMSFGHFLEYSRQRPLHQESDRHGTALDILCTAVVFLQVVFAHPCAGRSFWDGCCLVVDQPVSSTHPCQRAEQTQIHLVDALIKLMCRFNDSNSHLVSSIMGHVHEKVDIIINAPAALFNVSADESTNAFYRAALRWMLYRDLVISGCDDDDNSLDPDHRQTKASENARDVEGVDNNERWLGKFVVGVLGCASITDTRGQDKTCVIMQNTRDLSSYIRQHGSLPMRVNHGGGKDTSTTRVEHIHQCLTQVIVQWMQDEAEDDGEGSTTVNLFSDCLQSTRPRDPHVKEGRFIRDSKLEVGVLLSSMLNWKALWRNAEVNSGFPSSMSSKLPSLEECLYRLSPRCREVICACIDDPLELILSSRSYSHFNKSQSGCCGSKLGSHKPARPQTHGVVVMCIELMLGADLGTFPQSLQTWLLCRKEIHSSMDGSSRRGVPRGDLRASCSHDKRHEPCLVTTCIGAVQAYISRCKDPYLLALCVVCAHATNIRSVLESSQSITPDCIADNAPLTAPLTIISEALGVVLSRIATLNVNTSADSTAQSAGIDMASLEVVNVLFRALSKFFCSASLDPSHQSMPVEDTLPLLEIVKKGCVLLKLLCYKRSESSEPQTYNPHKAADPLHTDCIQNCVNNVSSLLLGVLASIEPLRCGNSTETQQCGRCNGADGRHMIAVAQESVVTLGVLCIMMNSSQHTSVITVPSELVPCLDTILSYQQQKGRCVGQTDVDACHNGDEALIATLTGFNLLLREELQCSQKACVVEHKSFEQRDRDAMKYCLQLAFTGHVSDDWDRWKGSGSMKMSRLETSTLKQCLATAGRLTALIATSCRLNVSSESLDNHLPTAVTPDRTSKVCIEDPLWDDSNIVGDVFKFISWENDVWRHPNHGDQEIDIKCRGLKSRKKMSSAGASSVPPYDVIMCVQELIVDILLDRDSLLQYTILKLTVAGNSRESVDNISCSVSSLVAWRITILRLAAFFLHRALSPLLRYLHSPRDIESTTLKTQLQFMQLILVPDLKRYLNKFSFQEIKFDKLYDMGVYECQNLVNLLDKIHCFCITIFVKTDSANGRDVVAVKAGSAPSSSLHAESSRTDSYLIYYH